MRRRTFIAIGAALASGAAACGGLWLQRPAARSATLKIGVLGTMSGPAAMWGLVNKNCAETTAQMYNERGGVEIDGEYYQIEIASVDDHLDPGLAVTGAEQLVSEGIKYIIGPNVDSTSDSVVPILERAGAVNISYAFDRNLYCPPRDNSILGMVASYQLTPVVLKYLKENLKVHTVAFLSVSNPEWVQMRYSAVEEASKLGLDTVTFADFDISEETYSPGGKGYESVLREFVQRSPGALVLLGCPPSDTPRIVRDARKMGFRGLIVSHNSQELALLRQVAGNDADGFMMMIGAGGSGIRSAYLNRFMRAYEQRAGAWHDSAGTKVYALEMILATLQKAGKGAMHDTRPFKQAIENFEIDDPFVNRPRKLRYVGTADFRQRRQLGVPLILGEVRRDGIHAVFTGNLE